MSWVLSLARSGGTAGSQGGHETRRHRVRGPFPMGACLLLAGTLVLAGCGSSSNSTVAITQQQPDPQQSEPEPEPEPQTGGGSGEGEGDGGQGAGGGTPPTGTTTTEDGDGDTDSGDTTTTGGGGQTSTQQPPPQTGGGSGGNQGSGNQGSGNQGSGNQGSGGSGGGTGGGGSSDSGIVNNPPPNNPPPNNPSVVSSLSRSSGLPEPKAIENCGSINPFQVGDCAPAVGQSSSISGTGYTVDYTVNNNWYSPSFVNLEGKDRHLEANLIGRTNNAAFNPSHANYNFRYIDTIESANPIEVTYTKANGFHGFYSYEGASGQITEDVTLKANFSSGKIYIDGHIGDNNGITMEGTNFGQIKFSTRTTSGDGQFIVDNNLHFSNLTTIKNGDRTFNELKGSFKNDGSSTSFPTQVVGELKMKRFFDASPIRNNKPLEYNDNLFKRGDNALAGVFVADIQPLTKNEEGTLDIFTYGLWASETPADNRVSLSIPQNQAIPFPDGPLNAQHGFVEMIEFTYKRVNGFRGAYVYKDKPGLITADVHLSLEYSSSDNLVRIQGALASPFTMGNDKTGIVLSPYFINTNTGTLGGSSTAQSQLGFGEYDGVNIKENQLNKGTIELNVGFTGGNSEGSVALEKYPDRVGGELKITGFSLNEDSGYEDNSLVGVFVGDKESAINDTTKEVVE